MSKRIDDGGAAFPHQDWDACIKSQRLDTGMSLRDYFAAAALQSLLANGYDGSCNRAAINAYDYADAMIQIRKEGGQP